MYEDYPATGSHYKKIYFTFNMAAQHQGDDLPPRRISLLEEVKDLIEAQKNESSRTQYIVTGPASSTEKPESHAEFLVAICTV